MARLDEQGVSDISQKPMPISPNKFELRVFLDNHSIINDPLLRCRPYIVNILGYLLVVSLKEFPADRTYRKFCKHMVSESYMITKMNISMR